MGKIIKYINKIDLENTDEINTLINEYNYFKEHKKYK